MTKRSSFGPGHGFPITPISPPDTKEIEISEDNSSLPASKINSYKGIEEADLFVEKLLKPQFRATEIIKPPM